MVDNVIGKCDSRMHDNRGFSLVELIICVAILAVATIPLYQSMALSSRTNAKAQSLQNATSLAETVMEEIKSSSVDDLKIRYNGVKADGKTPEEVSLGYTETGFLSLTDGEKVTEASDAASSSNKLLTGNAEDPPKPFFVLYKNKAVSTQGEEFDVVATLRTSTYMAGENPTASDANSKKLPKIEEIDTLSQAVISEKEFLRYDKAALDFFRQNAGAYDASKEIVTKEIFIDKTDNDSHDLISVDCRVVYTDNTLPPPDDHGPHTYSRELFSGSFSAPDGWDNSSPIASNIYLFYKRSNIGSPDETVTIKDTTEKATHKVYFIYEAPTEGASLVIDGPPLLNVKVGNGGASPLIDMDGKSDLNTEGNVVSGDFELITNLDYKDETDTEKTGHIYKEEAGIRIYDVNVNLYKNDELITSITSTKEVKKGDS